MLTYKNYLQEPKCLTFDEMVKIHENIRSEVGTDPEAFGIYQKLVEKATEYANIRARWLSLPQDEKLEQEPSRTFCHDSLIVRFDMIARFLRIQGKPVTWRDILGGGSDPYTRKRIGDLACFLVFIESLNAR